MRCPVCRADNDDPTCRRCRADLSPLLLLEAQRAVHIAASARAAGQGDGETVILEADAAQQLRRGSDGLRWLAIGHLLQSDFARALAVYGRARRPKEAL